MVSCDENGGAFSVKKAELYFKYSCRLIYRSFHWLWNIYVLGLQDTPRLICHAISTLVHRYFYGWNSYSYSSGSVDYCKVNYSEKDKICGGITRIPRRGRAGQASLKGGNVNAVAGYREQAKEVYGFEKDTVEQYNFDEDVPVGIYDNFSICIQ